MKKETLPAVITKYRPDFFKKYSKYINNLNKIEFQIVDLISFKKIKFSDNFLSDFQSIMPHQEVSLLLEKMIQLTKVLKSDQELVNNEQTLRLIDDVIFLQSVYQKKIDQDLKLKTKIQPIYQRLIEKINHLLFVSEKNDDHNKSQDPDLINVKPVKDLGVYLMKKSKK